ncbi:protein FLUORESCENT IN BLUE LIGHT, chloroplastic-like isoform X1 [Tasmannia lanceolata]|uniref:protein FLUORESCENT IN BLUE LIGHT, chloroplastic-like isoform X1 n=1 Tax=Tasmannia lanceolata TaxID=3420 RepID=UPI004062D340
MTRNSNILSKAMAVLVRCSCPASRSNAGAFSRRSPSLPAKISGKLHAFAKSELKGFTCNSIIDILKHASGLKTLLKAEEIPLLPLKGENALMAFPKMSMKTQITSLIGQILSSSRSIYAESDDFLMIKRREACHMDQNLAGHDHIIVENLSTHQRRESFSFQTAFVLASALILSLPFDALAETCEPDNFNMPLLFAIALIGATVGGLVARQRKGELKRLNGQLRQINAALRRQAKIESYAPNLSYAPVGRILEEEVIVDPRKHQLISNLKTGKNLLRNQEPEKAFVEFKAALELAQGLGDPIEEKKAARGLGASLQRQGKYREAMKYHSMVLAISEREGEDSGSTEAYGAIADCYTELGDLEGAAKFYDKYIARLETD